MFYLYMRCCFTVFDEKIKLYIESDLRKDYTFHEKLIFIRSLDHKSSIDKLKDILYIKLN